MAPSLIEQLAAAPAVGEDYRPFALAPGRRRRRLRVVSGRRLADLPQDAPGRRAAPRRRPERPLRVPAVLARRALPVLHLRRPRLRVLRRLPLRALLGGACQPPARHAGPRPSARPRPLTGRLSARDDRLARRRLRRRRDAGATEPRRRRHPAPDAAPLHRVLAALVAGRRAPGRDQRHARPGHGRLRHRRRVRRVARGRRLRGVLRRPAGVGARRPAPRVRRRAGRPSGDRHLRAGHRLRQLGVGGPPRGRAPPGVGPGRRGPGLSGGRGRRDGPPAHRPPGR